METVDLMMVTYNRLPLTKQTLESLLKTTDFPFNLIIVDNGSSDGTQDFLKEWKIKCSVRSDLPCLNDIKLIFNEKNRGIGTGRNQALAASSAEWLSTIDNDVILPQNWLSTAINILNHNPTYVMIGVNFEGKNFPLVNKEGLEWQNKPDGNLGTACTVFNRKLHKLLGYFNTDFPEKGYSMEDSDWGMRVRVCGMKMGYIKENGTHLGEGENDVGEYREYKTKCHQANLAKFNENCRLYFAKKKSIYIPYNESP